jgi:4a-hydroxytetrahydrobiopterin dehydratase
MMQRKKLSEDQIREQLENLDGWTLNDGKLSKEFKTGDFVKGVNFVIKVGAVAEELNHHPDIHLFYPRVVIESYTHDVGGITEFDFALAAKIDALHSA